MISASGGGGVQPTIAFVSPAPSSTITATTPIVLDVTDPDTPNPSTFLFLVLPDASVEVVWDGGVVAFAAPFSSSTRVAIANGFRYTLLRVAGWPAGAITFRANALDETGGVAV